MKTRTTPLVCAALLLATAIGSLSYLQYRSADVPAAAVATHAKVARKCQSLTPRLEASAPAAAEEVPQIALGAQTEVRDWRAFTPKNFTVQLTPDLALPFRVTKTYDNHGRTVLRARINKTSDQPSGMDGAFLVSTASTADRWDAMVVMPGDQSYGITVRNGVSTVQPISNKLNCGSDNVEADRILSGQKFAPVNVVPEAQTAAVTASSGLVVNVLFLASPGSVAFYARFNDATQIDADCSNYVEAGNAMLENSKITNFTWNYLGVVNTPAMTYDETAAEGALYPALAEMNTGDLAGWVSNTQSSKGADQIVLLVGEQAVPSTAPDGLANEGGLTSTSGGDAQVGQGHYSAIVYPGLVDNTTTLPSGYGPGAFSAPPYIFVHESGHNFGCNHDRATMGATPGDGKYYYGFRFADGPDSDEGTVMSYATGLMQPYFSNPNVTIPDSQTGAPIALGVPIGQPLAADNAQVMTLAAPAMAATHLGITTPVITSQPQSVSVTAGQSITLSATASGGGLTYQWYKDGTAIPSAVSSSYGITSSATTDSGNYTMTVSNLVGSATTNAATVSVTPYVAPGGGGSSSSGGGGGGAPSEWFCGALALLALARRKFRRYR